MFVTRVVAGIVAFLALSLACSEPVRSDPWPDTTVTGEALVATRVAEDVPLVPLTNTPDDDNRGIAYGDLAQYEREIQDFDAAIRLNPEHANAYYNRGIAYGNLGQYERATLDYDEAIRLNPKHAVAYFNRGLSYIVLRQYGRALLDFDTVIRLKPGDAIAYYFRGVSYENLGKSIEAERDHATAKELGFEPP